MNKINLLTPVLTAALLFCINGVLYGQQSHTIILAGYHSVPEVNTPAAGTITVTLKADSLTIEGFFADLSNYYYGSAIFYGKEGEQGNQIINLNPNIADNRTGGTFKASKNTFKLNEGKLEALANGNLYISILSFDHKRGEIRGQIPPLSENR